VIGGCNKNDMMINNCEKFDILDNKWMPMPSMTHARGNPGTCTSEDGRYLYAFQGFVNDIETYAGTDQKVSKALSSIERLDLWNESNGWQEVEVHGDKLKEKGCFIMYPMSSILKESLSNQDKCKNIS
jgi:hypothetical protein